MAVAFEQEGASQFAAGLRVERPSDDFAAVSKEADNRLAGVGLLVRGRHDST